MNYLFPKMVITLCFLLTAKLSLANDSSAELAAGGLTFVKNPHIEMRSETLYLSLKKVRIRYVFFNNSDKDIVSVVAFPLPDIESYHYTKPFSIFPVDDPMNPFGFETRVNQQKVLMSIDQKAFAKGVDQTALLKKYHVSLFPEYSKVRDQLNAIPQTAWPELEKLGVIWIEEADYGKGMTKNAEPGWTFKSTYYWQQRFPAKKELIIEHEYHPVIGYTPVTSIEASFTIHENWYQGYIDKYCVDKALQKTIAAKITNRVAPYSDNRLSYILTTGANWAGPIKQFDLIIDKGHVDNLVSFCGEGVKKISPTQFAMHKTDFTPTKNLDVLFLIPNGLKG